MMNDVFGLIYAGERNYRLSDLVMHRSVAAIPLGGRYRMIDFCLSNMVDSGVRNIGVITQRNYKSLMDHIGSGKEWNLSRKNNGLFFLPPYDTESSGSGHYLGWCDAINSQIDYVHNAPQHYCLLSGSYTLYSCDFHAMMSAHLANNADITLLYNVVELPEDGTYTAGERFQDVNLVLDEDGRVRDIEYDSPLHQSNRLGMDVYLLDKTLLENLVMQACSHSGYNFVRDVLLPNLSSLRVYAVPYDGYVGRLNSLRAYYDINMDMLNAAVREDLFRSDHAVYTKIKDMPPARYLDHAQVKNCIVGDGCVIDGEVENCIIFRGVHIGRNAKLKGCIVMQECDIGEGCVLSNIILDKSVIIRRGRTMVGVPEYPMVIRKRTVL